MNNVRLAIFLIGLTSLIACQQKDKEKVAVVVNGKNITKKALDIVKTDLSLRMPRHILSDKQLLEELINRELLVGEARKKKLDQTPGFAEKIQTYKESLLAQLALQEYFKNNEITDADIKAEYDKQSNSEYKARHILVKSKDEAKAIIVQLNTGSDFSKLAKKHSTGPSASSGGDLGWFSPKQMVAPFSAALVTLENNEYTTEPVQTKFGWHIILRENFKGKEIPAIETMKNQLMPLTQHQKTLEYIAQLRKQAIIEFIEPEVVPEPAKAMPEQETEQTTSKPAKAMPEQETETK